MKALIKKGLVLIGLSEIVTSIAGKISVKLDTLKRRYILHRASRQKTYWEDGLKNYKGENLYGYGWGDPDSENDRLGNYKKIKSTLISKLSQGDVVVEIGCLGGKWTQYFNKAKMVHGVDLSEESGKYINENLPDINFSFYKTKGDELTGINANCANIIFSMDTFGHMNKKVISAYFSEMKRVLIPGGLIYLHLPFNEKVGSVNRGFAPISRKDIENLCSLNEFDVLEIDDEVIVHGVMLLAQRK
jgi:SAM-dependent methyltransferase